MEQEKELLNGQTSWLNEELKAKSEELLSLSRQKGNKILELKCNLENREDEVCLVFYLHKDVEKNAMMAVATMTLTIPQAIFQFVKFHHIICRARRDEPIQ